MATFEISADKPVAQLAVRLSDVARDGESTRVTYGLMNLTHRDSSANPEPLEPGRRYTVEVPLNGLAQAFPAGHRLRLSVSTSYWPLVWPASEAATVAIHSGGKLELPVRAPRADDGELRPFDEPEAAPELETTLLEPGTHGWRMIRDLESNVSTVEIINDQGTFRIAETGTEIHRISNEWYSFRWNEVNSVRGETQTVRRYERGDWRTEVDTRTVLTSTPMEFVINAQLDAYELDDQHGNRRVYSQNWQRSIPRDLV
ncbi:CocE/NonD family hydrolase C-terminal non-catalytic domain-containing protein [Arthrobacter sp. JSM 101049]|uniref:CocE/NonD family hydrolase C-terminal non-catalytic domain-containing protein n=1 Tax=Arthrobacter sp. JSM 101049 TaxID=929097 RepID=UPI00356849A3